ncbi:protein kinase [Streptomyces sp. NPDC048514]|uniref:serine/threonine-protein kinase n=1 Tax=Streptomyces sp. NPDC048514 TaxID=3365564 RepID=UPI00371077C4
MGEVFAGRYELADPIGRGGVGAVWRAWDHRRRRYVAAKVLQQRDAHSLLRFVREQALRIDHPHVLAPASWAADDDKVLFTMDLVAGGSLVHLVGDYGPLPPAFVCTLLDQLLSGLAAVHAEGVVHRDIKPANLLLEATGTGRPRLRLSDFGIAMRLGEPRLTETNLVVGTPGYLAPEQMLGAEPDFPADLFAVGLVALYLLEGAKPDAKALVQYFTEHGTPGAPTGVPEPLWQVVAALLQPDPAARFRTASGARKALASAAELLPEPGPDDELIEIFDQVGPLPSGFGADGPLRRASGVRKDVSDPSATAAHSGTPADRGAAAFRSGTPTDQSATGSRPDAAERAGAAEREGSAFRPDAGFGASAQDHPHTGSVSDTGSFRLPPPQDDSEPGPHPWQMPPPAGEQREYSPEHTPQAAEYAPRAPEHTPSLPERTPSLPERTPAFPERTPGYPGRTAPFPAFPSHDPTTQALSPFPQPYAPGTAVPPPPAVPGHRGEAATAAYTARNPQVPPPAASIPAKPPVRGRRAHRPNRRRPGPPAQVAIPVLLLALVCYAVGFWALTRA